MNQTDKARVYMTRLADGRFAFPRCIIAHINEIKLYAPQSLADEDARAQILKQRERL